LDTNIPRHAWKVLAVVALTATILMVLLTENDEAASDRSL